jgi:hypothetical protein
VRLILGAAIPFLLSVLSAPEGNTRTDLAAARIPARNVALVSALLPAFPAYSAFPAFPALDEGDNLRVYVERARSYLDDPRTMYYVSQALEECYAWGAEPDADEIYAGVDVISRVDLREAKRSWAAQALAAPCRGLERYSIDPREILALLEGAAQHGEPHARAHMLIFRDVAAPKSDVMPILPDLLATGDPQVVRDVGAFLTRGEVSMRYGEEEVDAPVAAIAWELAACDMGYPCGPMSRIVLTVCAYRGYCDDYLYDIAIAHDESPGAMAQAQRLRSDLVHALRRQDWSWLGLAG